MLIGFPLKACGNDRYRACENDTWEGIRILQAIFIYIIEVEWNASDYPGGVYFYSLQTESYSETKKMILVK
ncbi:MAG: hypothetical protein EHM58_06530 [Ignavibacteriae bacterium]|nr:MAG: hypothetical protein EHM58_06530 [Ignavibacteriota bacterium]